MKTWYMYIGLPVHPYLWILYHVVDSDSTDFACIQSFWYLPVTEKPNKKINHCCSGKVMKINMYHSISIGYQTRIINGRTVLVVFNFEVCNCLAHDIMLIGRGLFWSKPKFRINTNFSHEVTLIRTNQAFELNQIEKLYWDWLCLYT